MTCAPSCSTQPKDKNSSVGGLPSVEVCVSFSLFSVFISSQISSLVDGDSELPSDGRHC